MNKIQRKIGMIVGAAALAMVMASPGAAQTGAKGLIDANAAPVSDLQALPGMTPAIVKAVIAHRPYKTVVDLNKVLVEEKLSPAQETDFFRRAFVKINLDTGTREEFMLIPGVGSRMSAEFAEYRPWKSWAQFDKEIGKYVGQPETDRLKQYMIMPGQTR